MISAKTIVEFGFFHGDSARNFLAALGPDGRLYSYDLADRFQVGEEMMRNDPRFKLHLMDATLFNHSQIDNRFIDFAFLDASHDPGLSYKIFHAIEKYLTHAAIVAVHDTGRHVIAWEPNTVSVMWDGSCNTLPEGDVNSCVNPKPYSPDSPLCQNDQCECRCGGVEDAMGYCCGKVHSGGGEREFMNLLQSKRPAWKQLYFHNHREYRHGITLLQRGHVTTPPDRVSIH